MDEILKSEMLLENLARAIAEGNEVDALKYYEEYKKIYEKTTCKNLPITFEELKKANK